MDISDTLAPNSDQLDAIDLLGNPRTFTITKVTKGKDDQPVDIHLAEFPRVWRPGKSMRRVLAACWGTDASVWAGRRVTLYCDETVRFGNDVVGGTRISHLSDIPKAKSIPLLVSRGKSAAFKVQPLADAPKTTAPAKPLATQVADALEHYAATFNVTAVQLEDRLGKPTNDWTPDDLATLRTLAGEMSRGEKHVDGEFSAGLATPAAEPEGAGRG